MDCHQFAILPYSVRIAFLILTAEFKVKIMFLFFMDSDVLHNINTFTTYNIML